MRRRQLSPAQVLSTSFLGLIALGTILLDLPVSAAPGRTISALDALFTSTSAVCVTGLIVLDTPVDLSGFGEIVVMLLIQAGGLGYMTISTLVTAAIGKRLTFQERFTLQESLNIQSMEGLVRFAFTVFKMTLAFELTGALILTLRWWSEHGLLRAAYLGVFHAVSAFNNAGFSLFSDNLARYGGDFVVNAVVALLIVAGGLGFLVLSELGHLRRRLPLSLHAKLVIGLTALLIVLPAVVLFTVERRNPGTLGPLGTSQAMVAALFQAITPRTAGFNTVNVGAMRQASLFLLMALMFIGASPGGTGGGIKVTTFGITVAALWATVRGHPDTVLFHRRLPAELVARAFFISLIAFLALNLTAGFLLFIEPHLELLPALFETTSAFGTVGLSMGQPGSPVSLCRSFSPAGQLLITVMMFVGRVGPLTLALALAGRREVPRLRYPEGKVLIG